MTSSITDIPKKRGRPSTGGRQPGVMVRLSADLLADLDAFIEERRGFGEELSRPEALRGLAAEALVEMGLRKP